MTFRVLAVAFCFACISCTGDLPPKDSAADSGWLDGLWSGSWGGGQRNGVVFQPVIAEMVVNGDRVDVHGFRSVGRLLGTLSVDPAIKRIRISPAAAPGEKAAAKAIDFDYQINGDRLTLTDSDKVAVELQRKRVEGRPLANVQVEFVAADGINPAGDLLVTEFAALKTGQAGAVYFQPAKRTLKTKQATVLLVQETGLKKVSVEEARKLIGKSTPIAVAYRQDENPSPHQLHELWKDMGPTLPDSDAAVRTLARTLRPGILVFVLSAKENVPVP